MIQGVKVNMGGVDREIPPLNFKQLQAHEADLRTIVGMDTKAGLPSGDTLSAVVRVVHAALTRNYPEMTADEVSNALDMGNLRPVLMAVMGQSGFTQGEAKAGQS